MCRKGKEEDNHSTGWGRSDTFAHISQRRIQGCLFTRINLSSGLRWRCQPRSKSLGLPWLFTQEFCRNLLAKYRLRAVTCARNCKALSKQVDKKCNKSLSRHMDQKGKKQAFGRGSSLSYLKESASPQTGLVWFVQAGGVSSMFAQVLIKQLLKKGAGIVTGRRDP